MNNNIENTAESIIEDFSLFSDWEDKYTYIIDLGKHLDFLDNKYKIDEFKVLGCTSQVWLKAEKGPDQSFYFYADSDSHIVKGLLAILLKIYNGKNSEEILSFEVEDFFSKLGLKEHLSPSRSNGFFAIVKKIRDIVD